MTVRIGIIGAGVAAETHARELARIADAEVCAVWARNQQKAAAFAAAFSIAAADDNLANFLARPEMQAVIITTPNALHLDVALAAAKAGKHLIIEKPLEVNAARAQQIVDICREHQVALFVIYQRVYSAAARQAASDIASGQLGQVFLVNIVDNQYRPPHYYARDAWRGTQQFEGGGCVITQSTHMLDLAIFLLGAVTSVYAATNTVLHQIETEDVAVAVLQFASGAVGTLSSSTAAWPGQKHLLTLSGTAGSIMINGEHDEIVFRSTHADGTTANVPHRFSLFDPQDPRDYPTSGQFHQLQDIVRQLASGEFSTDAQRALLSVRLVDAIYRSAQSGLPQPV